MTTFLQVRDLRVGYRAGPDVLNGVSLNLSEGSTTCIIGPNGSGKSTTLKAIAGLLTIRAGTVALDGERLNGLRADQILARGVCFVPQDRSLFPDMTVKDNLVMAGYSLRSRAKLATGMDEALEAFPELASRHSQRARTLSGGLQQMLALARAWILRPSVLLIDEPTMGLAPRATKSVLEVIQRFRSVGATILLVEQNARQGLACADFGYVLDLGRKRFEGRADAILADQTVRELYMGRHANDHGK